MKIGFIVQRYGPEILGGSEYHCRLIAERLAERHQVDVLTTCAREYTTWQNEYPPGTDRVRGVTVRRFPVTDTRDLASFNQLSERVFYNSHSRQDELEWLKRQGPWAPALIEYLERQHEQYDVLIFFTYLYAPTVLGLKVAPWKSFLVPTAHDEPAIHLGIYQDVFAAPVGIVWNTERERAFVSSQFSLRALVEDIVGCGVDLPEGSAMSDGGDREALAPSSREAIAPHLEGPSQEFRRRHRMYSPFILYGGRIDPGKGCEELLEYFKAYLEEGGDVSLVLMGTKLMPLPDDPRVRFAGTLSDNERFHALAAASVVVVPSPYESLSLLALEAFAVGTPVLANARSEVLVEHCHRSQAGLYYANRWEFIEALKLLTRNPSLAETMGRNGQAYVDRHYRWSTILAKYERMFTRLGLGQTSHSGPSNHGNHGGHGKQGGHGKDAPRQSRESSHRHGHRERHGRRRS